jgi:hypothetical protein
VAAAKLISIPLALAAARCGCQYFEVLSDAAWARQALQKTATEGRHCRRVFN